MKLYFCAILIALFNVHAGASDEVLFKSQQITKNNLFTKGIEGPAVDKNGNLYAVNFLKAGTIGKVTPTGEATLWMELPQGSVSSAIRFNTKGEMLVADYKLHRILKMDLSSKQITFLGTSLELQQPNDFTVSRSGSLFLSDPSWQSPQKGGIWLVENGKFKKLATNLKAVNGIDLSPDEKKLYFTESIQGGLWAFDVKRNTLRNKKLLYQFKSDTVDGLRVDQRGTIYVARIGEGKIDCISPEGKLLRSIKLLGKEPTNLAFGGPDGKTVYTTIRDTGAIESFRVDEPGREWMLFF